MKKLLLSACLMASSLLIHAQDNWLTRISNGSTQQTNFNLIKNFHDTLFIAGKNQNYTFSMYKHGPGFSLLAEDSSLRLNLTSGTDQLSSIAANNNYLFLGTGSSSGSSVNYTQVYKRDVAGNYTTFDSIRHYTLPSANQGNNGSYPKISALQFYSPTGANDSIYAFFTPDPNYGNQYLSVWKSSLSTPHWAIANAFPSGSDFIDCNATITWHGALYAAVTGYQQNTNYIISTNNGVDFTTVATSTATALGLPANTKFAAFAVYNDTLMAAVSSSYSVSTPVFYTVNGTTWQPYFTTTIGFNGITDMKSFAGKLWLQVLSYSNGYPEVYYYSAKTGFKQSTGSTDFEASFWNGSSFKLDTLQKSIFSSGYAYFSGTGPQFGTPYNNGALFNLIMPKADFYYNTSGTICSTSSYYIQNSSNTSSLNWYVDGINTNSSSPPVSLPAGTHTLAVVAYSNGPGSLSDSTDAVFLTVYPGFDQYYPSPLIQPNTICAGQTFTVTDTTNYTGANRPYTYYWQYPYGTAFAGDSLQQLEDTMTTGTYSVNPHTYNHYVKSSDGCTTVTTNTFTINVPLADSLTGIITDTNNVVLNQGANNIIYLFKQKANHVGVGDTIGPVNVASNGTYVFNNVLYGNYYAKVIADTNVTAYKTSVGTYYNNGTNLTNYQWYNGVLINHHHCTGGNDSLNNIKIIQMPAQTGNAIVSGAITLTNTFGMRYNGHNQTYGSPLKGIDVKLGKTPGGGCSARTTATTTNTTSNATYTYSFSGVDAAYQYKIYVDIPNYGMDTSRTVSFTTGTLSINNDYYVDSTMIRVSTSVGILKIVTTNSQLSLFPNPASDAANLSFQNNEATNVSIQLYDINGKQISTLYNQKMQQGKQTVPLNLENLQLSPSVYFIRANINNTVETVKLTIMGN